MDIPSKDTTQEPLPPWLQEDKKSTPPQTSNDKIIRNCESAKAGADSTRANTTDSNSPNRGTRGTSGKLNEKILYLKSAKQDALLQSKNITENNAEQLDLDYTEEGYVKGKKMNMQVLKQSSAIKMAGRMVYYDPTLKNNGPYLHSAQKRSNCFSEERKAYVIIYILFYS